MRNKEEIDKEVEKTMRSLDGAERAVTDDYFFSRLESRIENREEAHSRTALSWSFAAVMLIIIGNMITLYYYAGGEVADSNGSSEEIAAMADEYYLTVPSIYDYEQETSE